MFGQASGVPTPAPPVGALGPARAPRFLNFKLCFTHSPLSSSLLGLPYRILHINHKKELLRGLWVTTTPDPKPRRNAGTKPKEEQKPSTLKNLHPKPSLSPCRLEALLFNPKP